MAYTLQEIADKLSLFPGNALGSTNAVGDFPTGAAVKVGEGASQTSWSSWLSDISSYGYKMFSPLGSVMPTAAEIVKTAGTETANLVSRAEAKVTAAATGIGDTIKFVSYALIALAIIYALALFGPVLLAPFAGRK